MQQLRVSVAYGKKELIFILWKTINWLTSS